jgi:hypothetical protein
MSTRLMGDMLFHGVSLLIIDLTCFGGLLLLISDAF